jgi:CheY-like chemotaxis protein
VTARKIAEEALVLARDEAQRANAAKSQFLSQMSHELRTPLNAILGLGQLLVSDQRAPLPADKQAYMQHMMHGARHLLELISEVLDLGQIEAGQLNVSVVNVALHELLNECLSLMRPLAAKHDVRLPGSAVDAHGLHVRADRRRLKQVVLNLLGNAIKYNRRPGSVTLEVRDEADAVRIGVRDTGRGLSPGEQARLFQPFDRLGAAQRGIEGTGIGLVLSRRLTEAMGGTIGVESEPGVGSLFWLRLGRAAPSFPIAPARPAPGVAGEVDTPPGDDARRSVLYIEDNPVNVFIMEAMFERLPELRLHSAATPTVGLQIARAQLPELILLDMQLPEMDGIEVLRRLRSSEQTRHIPVVSVSADAMPEQIAGALEAGALSYLTKPVRLEELIVTVRAALASPAGGVGALQD